MISIHNSENELAQKPELIQKLGIGQFIYQGENGDTLPFCQYIHGADKPGKFILVYYFHGAGSRGDDNFLQVRIGAPPLASYCERHNLKAIVIMPQCRENCKWVDVPWESESHTLPPEPSRHMKLALGLLDAKLKEFDIDRERIYTKTAPFRLSVRGTWRKHSGTREIRMSSTMNWRESTTMSGTRFSRMTRVWTSFLRKNARFGKIFFRCAVVFCENGVIVSN